SALLEFSEVLHGPQAALRAVNLLIGDATQADGIQTQATLTGAHIRSHMELPGGVAVDVAIQARDTETGILRFAVIGGIELLLRKRSQQEPETIELHGRENAFEQPVVIVDRDDLAA